MVEEKEIKEIIDELDDEEKWRLANIADSIQCINAFYRKYGEDAVELAERCASALETVKDLEDYCNEDVTELAERYATALETIKSSLK